MARRIRYHSRLPGRPDGEGFFAAMTPESARRQLHVSIGVAAALFAGALIAAAISLSSSREAGRQTAVGATIEMPGHVLQKYAGAPATRRGG